MIKSGILNIHLYGCTDSQHAPQHTWCSTDCVNECNSESVKRQEQQHNRLMAHYSLLATVNSPEILFNMARSGLDAFCTRTSHLHGFKRLCWTFKPSEGLSRVRCLPGWQFVLAPASQMEDKSVGGRSWIVKSQMVPGEMWYTWSMGFIDLQTLTKGSPKYNFNNTGLEPANSQVF